MVAEFLLKRTTATAVKRVYAEFLTKYPDINSLSNACTDDLEAILSTLGYYRLRAKAFKETSTYIVNKHLGNVPSDLVELLSIPNIGHYSAGAILSLGYGIKAPMVDSNVERVITRAYRNSIPKKAVTKWARGIVEEILPDKGHDQLNLALIDIGAIVCTYRTRHCKECPIKYLCDSASE